MPLTPAEQAAIAVELAETTLNLHTLHVCPDGRVVCSFDADAWPCEDAFNAERTLRQAWALR